MHDFISLNGNILRASEAYIPAVSSAALYGKGVFTTVAVHRTKPFLVESHWQRLTANARQIGINVDDLQRSNFESDLSFLIKTNKIKEGLVRATIFDESQGPLWGSPKCERKQILLQSADFRVIPESMKVTFSNFRMDSASPLSNVKSCNYLDKLLAIQNARESGFDEAIRLNQNGNIVSACMANVFWVKDSRIFTPDISAGCLAGTTRGFVLKIAAQIGFDISFVKEKPDSLLNADEVFLTSAGIGITSVGTLDGRSFESNFTEKFKTRFITAQT